MNEMGNDGGRGLLSAVNKQNKTALLTHDKRTHRCTCTARDAPNDDATSGCRSARKFGYGNIIDGEGIMRAPGRRQRYDSAYTWRCARRVVCTVLYLIYNRSKTHGCGGGRNWRVYKIF